MRCIFLITFFLSIVDFQSLAQSSPKQSLGWVDMTLSYKINEKLSIGGDFGYRRPLTSSPVEALYFRPTLTWKPGEHFKYAFAVADFMGFVSDSLLLNEFRMHQEVAVNWPRFSFFKVNHRVRIEERFFEIQGLGEQDRELRARYRFALVSNDYKLFGLNSPFYNRAHFEMFLNVNRSTDWFLGNAHRWTIELGNKITSKIKAELHYINQTVIIEDYDYKSTAGIWRLRLFYNFN